MRKILAVSLSVLVLAFGFWDSLKTPEEKKQAKSEEIQGNIYIYTDPDTKVQYVVYSYHEGYAGMGGITPRLDADGSLMIADK